MDVQTIRDRYRDGLAAAMAKRDADLAAWRSETDAAVEAAGTDAAKEAARLDGEAARLKIVAAFDKADAAARTKRDADLKAAS